VGLHDESLHRQFHYFKPVKIAPNISPSNQKFFHVLGECRSSWVHGGCHMKRAGKVKVTLAHAMVTSPFSMPSLIPDGG
jgi:hypothetical protein